MLPLGFGAALIYGAITIAKVGTLAFATAFSFGATFIVMGIVGMGYAWQAYNKRQRKSLPPIQPIQPIQPSEFMENKFIRESTNDQLLEYIKHENNTYDKHYERLNYIRALITNNTNNNSNKETITRSLLKLACHFKYSSPECNSIVQFIINNNNKSGNKFHKDVISIKELYDSDTATLDDLLKELIQFIITSAADT